MPHRGTWGGGRDAGATTEVVLRCPGSNDEVRWRSGERLEQLFENRCERLRAAGRGAAVAVDAGEVVLTYDQLDARANQLARHLSAQGVRPGDRIGLLFDQAVHGYASMLAVLKIQAAYVPLDASFPADRLAYIVADAGVTTVLSVSTLRPHIEHVERDGVPVLWIDEIEAQVAAERAGPLSAEERGSPVDELCYVIYTSGSTGRPKGVAIPHASICNFVRVAAEVYGITQRDRVYQGMTIAFDFSIEEIWVPWMVGATLVPKPAGVGLLGHDLHGFLSDRAVTALCCVPTLLATLEEDLPGLRFLLVSGEACPQDLVRRWHRPDRRFINVYGPTEATVSATWTALHPGRPVTIGVPLPTYSTVILDPDRERALRPGELGEIGIAGIGLASGYLNRDDLTSRVFVDDFLGIANNPSSRIYRTGDLGLVNDAGEIEYRGRIDTQVKIRGYRIELTEIESVLLQVPGIAQAAVGTHLSEPGGTELVAYYSLRRDTAALDHARAYEQLRAHLPGYMVPAYLEELAVIPMTAGGKADRKNLPAPSGARCSVTPQSCVGPANEPEEILAEELADVLGLDQVSVTSHFFDDLGANSLLLARFCAKVRKRAGLAPVAMKDVYLQPTIRTLAAALSQPGAVAGQASPQAAVSPQPTRGRSGPGQVGRRVGTGQYVLAGTLQLLLLLGVSYLTALIGVTGYEWISDGTGPLDIYLRSASFGAALFLSLCAIPILAKWTLIGRWKPAEIPVWSLAYVRFWVVKTLIRINPLVLFVGSPLYVLYLRALGAKIGRRVAIFSPHVPVCTDLLTIGDGSVIRKDSFFTCYRAEEGMIQTGTITLGANTLVSEATVLDIETSMGEGAQLGHASSLQASQAVPAGERWHGSPAQPAGVDYRAVAPAECGALRRVSYSAAQLLNRLLVAGPLLFGVGIPLLDTLLPGHSSALIGSGELDLTSGIFYPQQLLISFVLFFGAVLSGLAVVFTVPRVLNLVLTPDRVYPLYGIHYSIHRTIARMTNLRFYTELFGDSSYIVGYLRALGYDLSRVEQTGSNFGVSVKHETPYLSSVGSGTMVSDGLSIVNADFSSSSFRITRTSLGARSFLGNDVVYSAGSKTGDDCLFATKVLVPIDGNVREGVGLLGSPSFEIPRSVQRDASFDHLRTAGELRRRLAAKNRHNLVTIVMFLLVRWIHFFAVTVITLVGLDLYDRFGAAAIAAAAGLALVFSVAYFALVERAATGFRALRPRFCSIYQLEFWRHERFWKLSAPPYANVFNGTPFKPLVWWLLGVRIGRRVFDDGCDIPEKTLVTIGDATMLGAGTSVQCHSLEDGTFKSSHIVIGARTTIGTKAFVHYGVTMGQGSTLDPDSFLMKGEEVEPHERWQGNPAKQQPASVGAVRAGGAAVETRQLPQDAQALGDPDQHPVVNDPPAL